MSPKEIDSTLKNDMTIAQIAEEHRKSLVDEIMKSMNTPVINVNDTHDSITVSNTDIIPPAPGTLRSSLRGFAYRPMDSTLTTRPYENIETKVVEELKGLDFMRVLDVKARACDLLLEQSRKSIGVKPTIYNLFTLSFTKEGIHKLGFDMSDIEEVWKSIEKEEK